MDGPFLALRADAEAQPMVGQVGDHFVGVGVGRGAGAGLIDVDGEVRIVLAGGNFLGSRDDRLGEFLIELAEFQVGQCTGGFQVSERMDDGGRHGLECNGKVFDGARGGCAVQCVGRHVHFAHRVAFDAESLMDVVTPS